MSEEKPEAEDGLGQNVEHGIGDDLAIDADVSGSVGNTPDALTMSVFCSSRTSELMQTTYIGYTVQRIKVKPAMELKKVAVLASLPWTMPRPLKPSW